MFKLKTAQSLDPTRFVHKITVRRETSHHTLAHRSGSITQLTSVRSASSMPCTKQRQRTNGNHIPNLE